MNDHVYKLIEITSTPTTSHRGRRGQGHSPCFSLKSLQKIYRSQVTSGYALRNAPLLMKPSSENNPIHHAQKIKAQMRQLIDHLREDVGKVTEPKAQALFETSAEVLTGLVKAFDDYEKKSEEAWRTEPLASRPKERTPMSQGDKN
jgi:hypothetical protein